MSGPRSLLGPLARTKPCCRMMSALKPARARHLVDYLRTVQLAVPVTRLASDILKQHASGPAWRGSDPGPPRNSAHNPCSGRYDFPIPRLPFPPPSRAERADALIAPATR